MPFNVVYLHEVRGFELARVGLLLSLPALVALLVVGPVGTLIDRIGPRLVVVASLLIQIAAHITLATATTEPHAALGCVLLGFSGGIIWPAVQTLIGTIIPSHLRQRYFGVNFTLLNLGIGIGGILGGLFVDVTRPETFVAIYLIDAATFLAPLAIFLGPLRHVPVPAKPTADALQDGRAPTTGYRAVLRDRSLLLVLLIVFVASFVGYGQLNTGLPAYGREVGGISTQALGLAFAANTAVIVVLQLFVLQRIEGRRRTRMLVLMSGIWAVSFLLLGATGLVPGTIVAARPLRTLRGGVRVRRDLLPADPPGDGQRPGPRPPARPLQRGDEHRVAVRVGGRSGGRRHPHRPRLEHVLHRHARGRLRRGRLARPGRRAPHPAAGQRRGRRRTGRPGRPGGARSGVKADPAGRLDWSPAPRVVVPH